MSEGFVLKSTLDGTRLEFREPVRRHAREDGFHLASYTVALVGTEFSATLSVSDADVPGWSRYFSQLATDWSGWSGTRDYGAYETDFGISCTADRKGHVTIRVWLGDHNGRSNWRIEATIEVEAGQLDGIAGAAARYFGPPAISQSSG